MDDIVTKLRIPLPWMLRGITTSQLGDERREAADEIDKLRKELRFQARVISRHYEQFTELRKVIDVLRAELELHEEAARG